MSTFEKWLKVREAVQDPAVVNAQKQVVNTTAGKLATGTSQSATDIASAEAMKATQKDPSLLKNLSKLDPKATEPDPTKPKVGMMKKK